MATSDAPPQISGIEIAPAAPAAETPANAPSVHEPTVRPWELELLLSLSLVFALMQLPAQVDRVFLATEPHLDVAMRGAAFTVYQFAKVPLYLLIAAFLVHLAARASWVALIGLEAVFPAGIRWEGLQYGPVTRKMLRERVGSLQPLIDRADRFGSIVFSGSLAMVITFVLGTLFSVVCGVTALGTSRLLFGGRYMGHLYMGALVLFALPPIVTKLADQRFGDAVEEGSRAHRWLKRGAVLSYYNSGGSALLTVWLILYSNLRRVLLGAVVGGVVVSLFAFFIVKDIMIPRGAITADGYAYLPADAGARGMESAAYENLRDEDGDYAYMVSIQSDVVTGPYVRLFLPYVPARMNPAIAERCPGLEPLGGTGLRMPPRDATPAPAAAQERLLRCWQSLQPVKLNGQTITPAFRFFTHPRTGVRGVVAYLPTAELPRGENVLEVAGVPRPRDSGRGPRPASVIPFWR